ncbi:MAG: hypothetical protein J0H68_00465 [Sphingobacteriia bacterium]|nr:hypothetical protein [Sphingobacteriia bacterium]
MNKKLNIVIFTLLLSSCVHKTPPTICRKATVITVEDVKDDPKRKLLLGLEVLATALDAIVAYEYASTPSLFVPLHQPYVINTSGLALQAELYQQHQDDKKNKFVYTVQILNDKNAYRILKPKHFFTLGDSVIVLIKGNTIMDVTLLDETRNVCEVYAFNK